MNYIEKSKILAQQEFDREKVLALTNYDESRIPEYTVPSPIPEPCTAANWSNHIRPKILKQFKKEMYGETPPLPDETSYELLAQNDNALNGIAIRKEIRIHFSMHNGKKHSMVMLVYIPKNASNDKPAPAFLGLNFKGNHSTNAEKDILKTGIENPDPESQKEECRGCQDFRWIFADVIKRGYASATICYHDIFPDQPKGWGKSILNLFENMENFAGAHPKYSAIGAWSWGLSRAMDCLQNDPLIDSTRVAVHGHSRLGKTALWAGACDPRFKMIISSCSGCGGAALARRMFGETYLALGNIMPHWFVSPLKKYFAQEEKMPFDQNFLLALAAPRALAIGSASEDLWADPKGEFLSAYHAGKVYALFGSKGLGTNKMPPENKFLTGDISYHIRTGKHNILKLDWEHYMQIADLYLD